MNRYRFRRQVALGRYIAPTLTLPRLRGREGWGCHETRLIVEIDGGQHDRLSPREAERSGFLQNEGYRILRFWNNEVLANLDAVHETIADELGRITPTQTLPHQGGGPDHLLPPLDGGGPGVGVTRAKATEADR